MRRVVVTGLGVVAPNGVGKEAFWSACVEGRSGVRPVRAFDASRHPVKIAAEVIEFNVNDFVPAEHRKSLKIMGRASRFGVASAVLAVRDSGLDLDQGDPVRVGIVMGTGLIPIDLPELAGVMRDAFDAKGAPGELGSAVPRHVPLWLLSICPWWRPHLDGAQRGPNGDRRLREYPGDQRALRLIARGDADVNCRRRRQPARSAAVAGVLGPRAVSLRAAPAEVYHGRSIKPMRCSSG
jgi:3-oxoacyl-[acyl-carrier-protein] synthase II